MQRYRGAKALMKWQRSAVRGATNERRRRRPDDSFVFKRPAGDDQKSSI